MMKTLIFSHLYQRPGAPPDRIAALVEMMSRWFDHLRGPGQFKGDVLLFTNIAGVKRPGLKLQPLEDVPADPRRAHMHRVLCYDRVPVRDYDVAMQMDLDILARDDVNRLFPSDERLWAARSQLRTLEWVHAWTLLPRWRRGLYRYSGWRMREMGASACVVASATSAWEKNFGAWARLIRAHGDREPPYQADQSFLNLLVLKRTVPIVCWPKELIRHRDWDTAQGAVLFHFPGRLKEQIPNYLRVPITSH
jgi:hypothetical protein